MTWGAVAAAGVVAAGTIGSSLIASNVASDATKAQQGAVAQARQDLLPYQQAGGNALGALQSYLGLGPNGSFNPAAPGVAPFSATTFQQSPGYQWQLGQGLSAIGNRASAAGGVNSGNTMKALMSYGQGLANQDYYNAAGLYQTGQQNTLRALESLAGAGQNAAAGQGGFALQGGNAGAAGSIAQGQIAGNALNGLTSNPQIQQLFASMFSQGGGSNITTPAMMNSYNQMAAMNLPY